MFAAFHAAMLGQLIGPYQVVRLIGQGGMGSVFEAENRAIERRAAIKVLHAEFAQQPGIVTRFFNEARATNRVDHPGIVQIHESGHLPDGTAYIIMELLKGETLSQRLQRLRLPVQSALLIAWQVTDALSAAHGKAIVHRDLKPGNLMLVPDPLGPGGERVKVLDFGIAKLFADANQGRTASSVVMGTPTYMSPEQCRGAGEVDAQTDVYSLGCILYEMLTGRPPFVAQGAGELIGMHLFHEVPPLGALVPSLPAEVAELVHGMLHKDRQKRWTMSEAGRNLRALAERLGRSSAPGLSVAPVPPPAAASGSPPTEEVQALPPDSRSKPGRHPSTITHTQGQSQPRHKPAARLRSLGVSAAVAMPLALAGLLLTHSLSRDSGARPAGARGGRAGPAPAAASGALSPESRPAPAAAPVPQPIPTPTPGAAVQDPAPAVSPLATLDASAPGRRAPARRGGSRPSQRGQRAPAAEPGGASALPASVEPGPTVGKVPAPLSPPDTLRVPPSFKPLPPPRLNLRVASAESLYAQGRDEEAIAAGRIDADAESKTAWRIVGLAACRAQNASAANEAYQAAERSIKREIEEACRRNGYRMINGAFRLVR